MKRLLALFAALFFLIGSACAEELRLYSVATST